MVEFHNNLMAEGTSTATVDHTWNTFKQAILSGAAKFIPHKTARSTNKKPWISRETVRQIRQKPGIPETTQDKKSARPRSIQRFETQDPEENKAGLLEISGRYSNT